MDIDFDIVKLVEMDLIYIILVRNPFVILLAKNAVTHCNIRKYYLDTFLHFVL